MSEALVEHVTELPPVLAYRKMLVLLKQYVLPDGSKMSMLAGSGANAFPDRLRVHHECKLYIDARTGRPLVTMMFCSSSEDWVNREYIEAGVFEEIDFNEAILDIIDRRAREFMQTVKRFIKSREDALATYGLYRMIGVIVGTVMSLEDVAYENLVNFPVYHDGCFCGLQGVYTVVKPLKILRARLPVIIAEPRVQGDYREAVTAVTEVMVLKYRDLFANVAELVDFIHAQIRREVRERALKDVFDAVSDILRDVVTGEVVMEVKPGEAGVRAEGGAAREEEAHETLKDLGI